MAGSNVEAVVNIITEAVRNGRLVPGTRLVEADYTQGLGYSRSTVREAFQRLISSGLLAFERHRGVSVCKLTRKQAIDVYRVRATLEGLAARLATPAAHEKAQQFIELQERLDAAVAKSDLSLFSKLNTEFHSMIADAADNDYLLQAIKRFETSIFWLQFRVLVGQNAVFTTNDDHQEIVRAFVAGDAAAAEAAMVRHILKASDLVQDLDDDYFQSD
ncbi:GntR family transcriptional regulator [Maritalea porphyrae]|uniref:GntR family transcriptional regulator n=1 Tax=Maritalea porphyrae TaxID=880732 RepID=A0ABQ5UX97_9HYPH|nr:GntR family transcriptional regulator [Maritalea porphyrae]GLQ18996.1 GntR family transcriptional regulator [Maritalea porphyrae]